MLDEVESDEEPDVNLSFLPGPHWYHGPNLGPQSFFLFKQLIHNRTCAIKPAFMSPREKLKVHSWAWDGSCLSTQEHPVKLNNLNGGNYDVTFHSGYSSGTTAVRGDRPLADGYDHYWEIKITTMPYGTDVMVGIGTEKVILSKTEYCSLLGEDSESWGLSYKGRLQHNNTFIEDYGPVIIKDDVIGMHLDMWNGTLSYYINGQYLGIAFKLLKGKVLYPMACSTAAFSRMNLIYSYSCLSSLQTLCLQSLSYCDNNVWSVVRSIPGLRSLAEKICLDGDISVSPSDTLNPESCENFEMDEGDGNGTVTSIENTGTTRPDSEQTIIDNNPMSTIVPTIRD